MADENENKSGSSQSPPSQPPSPPLARSLVEVFGALESTLKDLTSVTTNTNSNVQKVAKVVGEVKRLLESQHLGNEKHQELVLSTMIELLGSVERLSQQEDIQTGAIVDARNALVSAKEQLVAAKKEFKEATGSHPLLGPDDPDAAPKEVHFVVRVITNLGWKHKKKVVAAIGAVATAAWTYAAPDIVAAFKTLWGG